MTRRQRRRFNPEEKLKILRLHLLGAAAGERAVRGAPHSADSLLSVAKELFREWSRRFAATVPSPLFVQGEAYHRRLAFMMLDRDLVAVSPSSVYRVLKEAGLLYDRFVQPSGKGKGFLQPLKPHEPLAY